MEHEYKELVGFGQRLFGLIYTQNGALRALPAHLSFAASYSSPKNKNLNYFQKQNASFGPPEAFVFPLDHRGFDI